MNSLRAHGVAAAFILVAALAQTFAPAPAFGGGQDTQVTTVIYTTSIKIDVSDPDGLTYVKVDFYNPDTGERHNVTVGQPQGATNWSVELTKVCTQDCVWIVWVKDAEAGNAEWSTSTVGTCSGGVQLEGWDLLCPPDWASCPSGGGSVPALTKVGILALVAVVSVIGIIFMVIKTRDPYDVSA